MLFFALLPARMPWGDYGDILANGLCETCADGTVHVARTGPFVPPISFPFGTILVTDTMREAMSAQGFSGLRFRPAAYARTVRLDWQDWDRTAAEPAQYPENGEPEEYILDGSHDPALAAIMPALWSFDVSATLGLQIDGSMDLRADFHPGSDVAREHLIVWINTAVKDWLEQTAPGWFSANPVSAR